MWLGTTYGLNRYDGFEFKTYQHDPKDPNTLSHSRIRALYNDRSGMLWIGTEKGLTRYDPRLEAFTRFVPDSAGPDSLSGEKVTVIYEDVQGRLWVGTEDGGLNQLDRETGRFLHYRHDPADPQSLASDQVTSIAGDTDGTLWVGTYGGLDRLVSDARGQRFAGVRALPPRPVGSGQPERRSSVCAPRGPGRTPLDRHVGGRSESV